MEPARGQTLGVHLLEGTVPRWLAGAVGWILGLAGESPSRAGTSQARPARAPRVRIRPLHAVGFARADAGDPVPVVNVSITGLALLRDPGQTWPSPGGELAGTLAVGGAGFPVRLRVAHVTHDVVGCGFVAPPREMEAAIQGYLAADLEALGMAYVPPADLAAEPDGEPHWFHGRNNSELYLVERRGAVVRFRLSYFANYLEGGEGRPVRFGIVTRERDLSRDERDSVCWLPMINAEQLAATLRFIAAIPGLRPWQRDGILHHIC